MTAAEQRAFFQRHGYVIVEGHLPPPRLADIWHGARANHTAGPRRMLHLGYAAAGSPTQYEIGATLTPELRRRLAPLADRLELP